MNSGERFVLKWFLCTPAGRSTAVSAPFGSKGPPLVPRLFQSTVDPNLSSPPIPVLPLLRPPPLHDSKSPDISIQALSGATASLLSASPPPLHCSPRPPPPFPAHLQSPSFSPPPPSPPRTMAAEAPLVPPSVGPCLLGLGSRMSLVNATLTGAPAAAAPPPAAPALDAAAAGAGVGVGAAMAVAGAGAGAAALVSSRPMHGSAEARSDAVRPLRDIRRADLVLKTAPQAQQPLSDLSHLRFGAQFTQHMLQVSWSAAHGWHAPRICPLEPLSIHPAAQVLQYGMSCFEGMKAYKGPDGRVRLFRPERNLQRLALSCHRLNLPSFNQGELLECMKELLRVERDWVPQRDGYSMYLRPTVMATTPFLGVGPPAEVLFTCILSPAGPYFPAGLKPISLFVDTKNVRAYPGGVGDRKVAGNYAPTILPQVEAARRGCAQVLYVLRGEGVEGRSSAQQGKEAQVEMEEEEEEGLVGESGAMNIFFLMRKATAAPQPDATHKDHSLPPSAPTLELVTPPLDGLVLPGVTRDSVLEMVRGWGEDIQVCERPVRLSELKAADAEGRLVEVFGTGTAVVVQPVSALVLQSGRVLASPVDEAACAYWTNLPPGQAHLPPPANAPLSVAGRVYRALLDIQYGHVDHPWSVVVT